MSATNSANDDQNRLNTRRRDVDGGGGGGGGGRRMTVLTREDSARGMECARGLECYSPARLAVCRLLAVARRCKRRRKEKVAAEEVEKREIDFDFTTAVDRRRIDDDGVSGRQSQEMSFNLAAGLGLLSLIAASKTELEKTAELRKQMETFLRNTKQLDEDRKFSNPNGPSDTPEVTCAVSTTIDGPSNVSPYSQEVSEMNGVCDKHCDDLFPTQVCVDEVSCLEEELAAELDRLQLDIETEGYGENQENVTQISATGTETGTGTGTGTGTVSSSREVVVNLNDGVMTQEHHQGVPPVELERRLHELLEARQEERIRELEAHVEYMKEKLQEKEVEVIWWKDTAKLISKQLPQSSRAKVICEGS